MSINFKNCKSNLAGAVGGLTYLLIAYLLDRNGTIIANIIGLICGAIKFYSSSINI